MKNNLFHNFIKLKPVYRFLLPLILNMVILNVLSQPVCTQFGTIPPTSTGKQLGMAGPITAILNDKLIIIGGSNFPDDYPWNKGKKKLLNEVHIGVLTKKNKIDWIDKNKYTFPVAFFNGLSATVNSSIFVFGGITNNGINNIVYRIKFDDKNRLKFDSISTLPANFTPTACGWIDNTILVHGYNTVENVMYRFDVNTYSWTPEKGLPGEVRSESTVSAMAGTLGNEKFYLFGGRHVNATKLSIFTDCWTYSPAQNEWQCVGEMKINSTKLTLMAAPVALLDDTKVVFFGGDDGVSFKKRFELEKQIKNATGNQKTQLEMKLREEFTSHKGFSSSILVFDTQKNRWYNAGSISNELLPVCTSALRWRDKILIPTGEIKPGIRSAKVLEIKLIEN